MSEVRLGAQTVVPVEIRRLDELLPEAADVPLGEVVA
jgi:hypothetical protein